MTGSTNAVKSAKGRSQTIERATLLLACFSAEEPHLSLAQLATKVGLNQSTVYRYVATLQAAGLLERDERRGGYQLGLRVIELSHIVLNQLDVRKHALEEMDRLRDEQDALVSLAVLFEGDVLHIAHAVPAGWPRWHTTVGRRAVAHCTALGKTLYAYRSWEDVRRTIAQYGWRPYTPRSITAFDRLDVELTAIRERGYAVDDEERRRDQVCIGVPVFDHTGRAVAALSLSKHRDSLPPDARARLAVRVREAADRVSFRLGYEGGTAYLSHVSAGEASRATV